MLILLFLYLGVIALYEAYDNQGGGISRASSGRVFNYMYSTAPKVEISAGGGSHGAGLSSDNLPMHGLGYGLPLSRLYAR